MQIVVIDFETYYASDYSLKQLGVLQYVRDPRFKVHGVGIQIDDQDPIWVFNEIEGTLKSIDWTNSILIGHNLYFDATVLFEIYGIVPKYRIDTMSLARGFFDRDQKFGLDNVADALGFGNKMHGVLNQTKGKLDLTEDELVELGQYCIQDVILTNKIYQCLIDKTPIVELNLIDVTLRMATAPILEINASDAQKAEKEAIEQQNSAILNSGVDKKILTSNAKFNAYLNSLGVIAPTKISARTQKETPALGQNDPEFIQLMAQHPELNALWKGREAAKSAIGITRAAKWNYIASNGSCKMPMPLNYYGAHTGRWSGMDGINVQNLPRGSLLRKSIIAPKDHVILVADSAQIELRMNAWFCGQEEVLRTQREGKCVYSLMAEKLFDKPAEEIYKAKGDERQFGKIVVLGCGYGMGWRKFQHFCASGPLGMQPKILSDDDAQKTIQTYRAAHPCIVDMWKRLNDTIILQMLSATVNETIEFGCLTIRKNALVLPNKMELQYPRLQNTENGWFYGNNHPIWGGSLLENIVQALARIVVAEQMLEIDAIPGVQVVGCTHDEVLAVCHKRDAEKNFERCIQIMSSPPLWAPDVPLSAEGGWAVNYSK